MEENILEGLFFVGDNWQGRIEGKVDKNLYVVQLYEWLLGAPSCVKLVPIDQMLNWDFYHTVEEWNRAGNRKMNERK